MRMLTAEEIRDGEFDKPTYGEEILNRFNELSARRRIGAASSNDLAVVLEWQQNHVPLEVVLRCIETGFKRTRAISSLAYFRGAVEDEMRRIAHTLAGANLARESETAAPPAPAPPAPPTPPYDPVIISAQEKLRQWAERISGAAADAPSAEAANSFLAVELSLHGLAEMLPSVGLLSAEAELEKMNADLLNALAPQCSSLLPELERRVKAQLVRLEGSPAYTETLIQAVDREIRNQFKLPFLSLGA